MKVLDLSQDFSMHTPAFASYTGPSIKWVKRLAFERAGGQEITTTLHVSTHLDAPAHFLSGGKFIGELPLDFLVGLGCPGFRGDGFLDFHAAVVGPGRASNWAGASIRS